MQDTQVLFPGGKDPLEKEMATHSSILAWRIPWTEETGGLQFMGSQESDMPFYKSWHRKSSNYTKTLQARLKAKSRL